VTSLYLICPDVGAGTFQPGVNDSPFVETKPAPSGILTRTFRL
jgi:hypothetical protein